MRSYRSVARFAAITFGVAGICAGWAASAQTAQDRQEQELGSTSAQGVGGTVQGIIVGGVIYLPYAEIGGGYDSNLDGRVLEQGSHFVKAEAGLRIDRKTADSAYSARARVRKYEYEQLDVPHRWDLDAALGAEFFLSPLSSLKFGTSYYRDKIALDAVDIYSSFADYQVRSDSYKARLKLLSSTQLATNDTLDPATTDPDVFDVARGRAFDHTRNGGEVSVLLFPKSIVAPFVFAGAFDVNYFHQAPNPSIDRNANYFFGVAGLRFNLTPSFFVDLGVRRNERFFEDVDVSHFDATAFDARLEWRVDATLKVKGVIERDVRETTASFGLADDAMKYRVTLEKKLGDKLFVIADAYFDDVRPIGDNIHYRKYTAKLTGSYKATPNLEYYVEGLARQVQELNFNSEYSRLRLEAGARLKF